MYCIGQNENARPLTRRMGESVYYCLWTLTPSSTKNNRESELCIRHAISFSLPDPTSLHWFD